MGAGYLEDSRIPMLFILIPLGWLAVAAFAVILCRGAATADALMIAEAESAGSSRTTLRAPAHSRLPANHVWRRHGAQPLPRKSAVRLRETRVGR
jgi:hypothetical protein